MRVGGGQLHGFQASVGTVDVIFLVIDDLVSDHFLQACCSFGLLTLLLQLVLTGPFLLSLGFPLECFLRFLSEFLLSGVLMAGGDERLLLGCRMLGSRSSQL